MNTDSKHAWVDHLSNEHLVAVLSEHGTNVNELSTSAARLDDHLSSDEQGFEVVPLRDGWLRVGADEHGLLVGRWIGDPGRPTELYNASAISFDEASADDLEGWMRARADIAGSGRRWISVLRRPERESYIALIYEAGDEGPVRERVVSGIYPDITLCAEDATMLAFVEPVKGAQGLTRAVLAPVGDGFDTARIVLRDSTDGGLGFRACSVRRFVKLSRGVRTLRLWDLVDVWSTRPQPITVPGVPSDPELFDVAFLDGELVLAQAVNGEGSDADHWELVVSVIDDGEIQDSWRAATGWGVAVEVTSGDGCALVRVRSGEAEHILKLALAGFSTTNTHILRSSTGLFSLGLNTVTPSVGFGAIELNGGSDPFSWFWDAEGQVLNPVDQIAERTTSLTHRTLESVTSEDGYQFQLDIRWRGHPSEGFSGPVILMVYGAYGLDIDLDLDHSLGQWLDRGFAVGTPHVRGGGGGARHLAGCRANRDRSLADLTAAVQWLRAGHGMVTASKLCTLGASAGGFLAATALNTCPDGVDACVIVNGFVDPLTSLLSQDTTTIASDQDEWGNPLENGNDLETLQAISPVDNLESAGHARALVVVSARDVRVNPRQGLKWFLTYDGLEGDATLWFDPLGAHDCWGAGMDHDAMINWVCDAMGVAHD